MNKRIVVCLACALLAQVAIYLLFFHVISPPRNTRGSSTAARNISMQLINKELQPSLTHHSLTQPSLAQPSLNSLLPNAELQAVVQASPEDLEKQNTSYEDATLNASGQTLRRGDDYLPASQLTERPVVLLNIDSELSARFAFIYPQSFELILLINEYGDVDRVLHSEASVIQSVDDNLPAVLLDELVQRFFEARFQPGRLHGQPVRSALKIRVALSS